MMLSIRRWVFRPRIAAAILGVAGLAVPSALGQVGLGTSFSYQGQVKQAGAPINGTADFQFRLFNAATGGTQVGSVNSINGATLTGGLFTAALDFGQGAWDGPQRYLEIAVRSPAGAGVFTTMTTRQPVRTAPVAQHLRLPYSGTTSVAGPAVTVTNSASGAIAVYAYAPGAGSVALRGSAIDGYGFLGTTSGSGGVGVAGTHESTSGTGPGVYGVTLSNTGGAPAILGEVTSTAPGADTKAVWGVNHSTNGIGVYGQSAGAGRGVYGEAGSGGIGVRGYAEGATGNAVLGGHLSGPYGYLGGATVGAAGHHWNGNYGQLGTATAGGYFRNAVAGGLALKADGLAQVNVLQILGGSDLAEPFDVSASSETSPTPGMLVVIDPVRPGQLRVSDTPYDTRIAGAISGANGLSPGMIMKVEGHAMVQGEHPVAMSGRIWVWCDAAFGVIEPGDRLTSSTTAGHAMRVGDAARAPGTVVGKAMTELNEGKGLVLVLVNLQ